MPLMKITRPGEHPGSSKIKNYHFVDGIMVVPLSIGQKLEKILCRYYGCTSEVLEEAVGDAPDEANPDLTKTNTLQGVVTAPASDDEGEEEEEEGEDN